MLIAISPGCLRADSEPWADLPMLVVQSSPLRSSSAGVPFQDLTCLIALRSGDANLVRDSVPVREDDKRWLWSGQ